MIHLLAHSLSALGILLLAPGAFADVLVVDAASGPGTDFVSLQAALDAAQPDDTVLIRSGQYAAPTIIAMPLAITADTDADVLVLGKVTVTGIDAGETLSFRGIRFESAGAGEAMRLSFNAGLILAESCSFTVTAPTAPSLAALHVFGSNHTVLTDCELIGADVDSFDPFEGSGLTVSSAGGRVFAFNTNIQGGSAPNQHGTLTFGSGRPAMVIHSGTLALTGGSASGGAGGSGISPTGGPCLDGGTGGYGAYLAGPIVRLDLRGGATVSGGPGGATLAGCSTGADGLDIYGGPQGFDDEVFTWPTAPRHWTLDNPSREGQSLTLGVHGPANEPTFMALSVHGVTALPGISPKGGLVVTAPLILIGLGSLDSQGELSLNLTYPDLGAGIEGLRFIAQTISVSGAGGVRFGDARALVFLDAAF